MSGDQLQGSDIFFAYPCSLWNHLTSFKPQFMTEDFFHQDPLLVAVTDWFPFGCLPLPLHLYCCHHSQSLQPAQARSSQCLRLSVSWPHLQWSCPSLILATYSQGHSVSSQQRYNLPLRSWFQASHSDPHLLSFRQLTLVLPPAISSTLLRCPNQNYNVVSTHTGQNGHHQKIYKQ